MNAKFRLKSMGPEIIEKINSIVKENINSNLSTELTFGTDVFPTSWEQYDYNKIMWRSVIDTISERAQNSDFNPSIKLIVAINIPLILQDQRPATFNWGQYNDPELIIDCRKFHSWSPGWDQEDPDMKIKYLRFSLTRENFNSELALRELLSDIEPEIRNEHESYANYFLPLGQLVQLKFQL